MHEEIPRVTRVIYRIERWSPARGGWIGVHVHRTHDAAVEMATRYHEATVRDGRSSRLRIVVEATYPGPRVTDTWEFDHPDDGGAL